MRPTGANERPRAAQLLRSDRNALHYGSPASVAPRGEARREVVKRSGLSVDKLTSSGVLGTVRSSNQFSEGLRLPVSLSAVALGVAVLAIVALLALGSTGPLMQRLTEGIGVAGQAQAMETATVAAAAIATATPSPTPPMAPTYTPTPTPTATATPSPPFTPTATPTPAPTATPTPVTYIVQRGDYLSAIAGEYGVTVEDLVEANGITDPNRISVGQVLVIPRVTPATTETGD